MAKQYSRFPIRPGIITPRRVIQLIFLFITLFIGIKFYAFVAQLEAGTVISIERPPGVEAFLPISALVSLKYFLVTGIFNQVHPSALVLFLVICSTALVFKKGFCSWICPLGLLSDVLAKLLGLVFKKKRQVPQWMDLILRGIKYAIVGFFIWGIFIKMPVDALGQFIQSPYNRFADVKMLEFFTHISSTAFIVILVLTGLSLVIPHFWCRYLCPYGALLSLLGVLSMGKINRNSQNCINCKKCEAVCPAKIQITREIKINSLECSTCLRCVYACPQKDAIGFSLQGFSMNPKRIAFALITLFAVGIITAKQTGYWQNNTSVQEYRQYLIGNQMPQTVPRTMPKGMDPEKIRRMTEMMKKMKPQLNKTL